MTERKKKKRNTRNVKSTDQYFDYSMLAVLIFLICFGLVMLFSTSSYSALIKQGDSMFYLKRQLIFCVVGFLGMIIVSTIDYHYYIKLAKPLYWFSIFLMALVKTPLGKTVNGARRWLRLPGNQQFQPAEVAKIAVILFIPVVIIELGKEAKTLNGILKTLAWGGFNAACVYILTDNLSTGMIVLGITCILIFVMHPKTKPFLMLVGAGVVDKYKLPTSPCHCMAAPGKICFRRKLSDFAGTVRNRFWRILWKRVRKQCSENDYSRGAK